MITQLLKSPSRAGYTHLVPSTQEVEAAGQEAGALRESCPQPKKRKAGLHVLHILPHHTFGIVWILLPSVSRAISDISLR